jgi:hypothetical protein
MFLQRQQKIAKQETIVTVRDTLYSTRLASLNMTYQRPLILRYYEQQHIFKHTDRILHIRASSAASRNRNCRTVLQTLQYIVQIYCASVDIINDNEQTGLNCYVLCVLISSILEKKEKKSFFPTFM